MNAQPAISVKLYVNKFEWEVEKRKRGKFDGDGNVDDQEWVGTLMRAINYIHLTWIIIKKRKSIHKEVAFLFVFI